MIIIYILSGIIIAQSILHYIERKDLYTRLMCKDATEYRHMKNDKIKQPVSRHKEVLKKWRGMGGDKE